MPYITYIQTSWGRQRYQVRMLPRSNQDKPGNHSKTMTLQLAFKGKAEPN